MFLLASDLHLTDRPRDAYRFQFLTWLLEAIQEYRPEKLIILGDLTDAKDCHSAVLISRIVEHIEELTACVEVIILKGNHDYLDPSTPFFAWLSIHPRVRFISKPAGALIAGKRILMLPHTSSKEGYNGQFNFSEYDYIFCHQTFDGARGENGQKLHGISPTIFNRTNARVYSGDVHVPQRLGKIEYVGAPYPIKFGDEFQPRILLDDLAGKRTEILVPTIRKCSLSLSDPSMLTELNLKPNDQVKLVITLPRSEFHRWEEIRQQASLTARRIGIELHGLELKEQSHVKTPRLGQRNRLLVDGVDIYAAFCSNKAVEDDLIAAGRKYL